MNLASIIDDHDADSVALIHRGRPTTYGQLRDQVDRTARRAGLARRLVTATVSRSCAATPTTS